jgi:hypothetical protein
LKIFYILGLGHSGSTLTNHLLSSQPGFLALGEVAQFFSPQHMVNYTKRWGGYPDMALCSCGRSWGDCTFWGVLQDLNGLNTTLAPSEKYRILLESVGRRYGEQAVIVDSSKSLEGLSHLTAGAAALGIPPSDIHVILTLKDVRNFVASSLRQSGQRSTVPAVLRAMNLWLVANRTFLRHLETAGLEVSINLYEHICRDPLAFLRRQSERANLPPPTDLPTTGVSQAHIVLSNKGFLSNDPSRIRYDSRWLTDDRINLAYLLHAQARVFNHRMHRLAG